MARPLRIAFKGACYHVMARGNAKAVTFLDDGDYRKFMKLFEIVCARFAVICYAYCLMPNHYHLVVMTPEANLSAAIKHLNGVYSQWWNFRHRRCGHLFQSRFKSPLIQRERYLAAACRYVVLNPQRAGLVSHPSEWIWSSYRASVGLEPAPKFLDVSNVSELLGVIPAGSTGGAYRSSTVSTDGVAQIAEMIRRNEPVLGDDQFMAEERKRAAERYGKGLPRRELRNHPVELSLLFGAVRSKLARNEQIGVARWKHGYGVTEIAAHLGLHRATVGEILRTLRLAGKRDVGQEQR